MSNNNQAPLLPNQPVTLGLAQFIIGLIISTCIIVGSTVKSFYDLKTTLTEQYTRESGRNDLQDAQFANEHENNRQSITFIRSDIADLRQQIKFKQDKRFR